MNYMSEVRKYENQMAGEVVIKDMVFKTDNAIIGTVRPVVIGRQILENQSDIEQSMTFSVSKTEGRTSSISTEITFEYSISPHFKIGFASFAEFGFQLDLGRTETNSLSQEVTETETKTYTYPLVVPAH